MPSEDDDALMQEFLRKNEEDIIKKFLASDEFKKRFKPVEDDERYAELGLFQDLQKQVVQHKKYITRLVKQVVRLTKKVSPDSEFEMEIEE